MRFWGLGRISSPAWSEARGSLGAFPHLYSCTLLRGPSRSLSHQPWAPVGAQPFPLLPALTNSFPGRAGPALDEPLGRTGAAGRNAQVRSSGLPGPGGQREVRVLPAGSRGLRPARLREQGTSGCWTGRKAEQPQCPRRRRPCRASRSLSQASFGEKGGSRKGVEPTAGESRDFAGDAAAGSCPQCEGARFPERSAERAAPRLIPTPSLQGERYLLRLYRWGN